MLNHFFISYFKYIHHLKYNYHENSQIIKGTHKTHHSLKYIHHLKYNYHENSQIIKGTHKTHHSTTSQ